MSCAINGDTIRFAANVDTIKLLAPLTFNKNIVVLDEIGNKVVLKFNLSLSGFANNNAGVVIQANSQLKFDNLQFNHSNISTTKPIVLNFGNLTMKNCNLNGNPKTVMQHAPNGSFFIEGVTEVK